MHQTLEGQVAIVSGSSGGLGKAYARYLASCGARVIVNGTSERVDSTVAELSELSNLVYGIKADVANPADCRRLVEQTIDRWGRIDILVNNAGDEPREFAREVSSLDLYDLDRALRVNVHGAYNLTIAVWDTMREQGGGRVLNICSGHMFGSYGDFGLIPQAIAKSAVIGLTRSFACAGRKAGIRVNAIFPAALDTGTNRGNWELSMDEFAAMAQLAPAAMVAPVVEALVGAASKISGEMFSSCNRNVTRVFIADTAVHDYTAYASVEACLQACLNEPDYAIPDSIGTFFGRHLSNEALEKLCTVQQQHRRPAFKATERARDNGAPLR
jgi:NAD(P)-dependent dehydrogenase (short-subunit alcohol dehydrogenase family)